MDNLNPINPITLTSIESNLRQMISILNASESGIDAMAAKTFLEAKPLFLNTSLSINHARTFVKNIEDIWPQGKRFIQKMNHSLDILQLLIDNSIEWKKYISNSNFDSSKLSHAQKYQDYVMKNRDLGSKWNAALDEASKLLESLAGLNLNRLWDEDVARNP